MQLLYPYFLVAGLVLVIPIIVHLFNLRKFKTVYYSDISLLEEIALKSKKKKTLKELLVLLTRLVLLIALVVAFAYPFFEDERIKQVGTELVVLDNSQSAAVFLDGNEVLQQEKELMVQVYESKSDVRFLSNDVKVFNQLDQEGLFNLINQSVITPHQLAMSDVNDLVGLNDNIEAVTIYSPFSNAFNLDKLNESKKETTLVHFDTEGVAKILIDSVWVNQLKQQEEGVSTVNLNYLAFGVASEYEIKLFVNGELRGSKEVTSTTGQVEFVTHFTRESNQAVAKCYDEEGQEVSAFYFVVRAKKRYQVSLVGTSRHSVLSKAFGEKSDFDLYEFGVNQIDFDKLLSSDLVFVKYDYKNQGAYRDVVSQLLKNEVKVCLFFKDKIDEEGLRVFSINNRTLKDSLTARVEQPNSKLYEGVFVRNRGGVIDLPEVRRKNTLSGLIHPLLKNEFNETVIAQSVSQPNLFVSTEDLSEETSFTSHSLYIPTIYQFLFFENSQQKLFIRPNTYFDLPSNFALETTVDLLKIADSYSVELSPITQGGSHLLLLDENLHSGWYQLSTDSASMVIGVNEKINTSTYTYHSLDELMQLTADLDHVSVISSEDFAKSSSETRMLQKGYPLWKYFLIIVLVFLFFEMIVLNSQSGNRFRKEIK
jgi:hypothetical protein